VHTNLGSGGPVHLLLVIKAAWGHASANFVVHKPRASVLASGQMPGVGVGCRAGSLLAQATVVIQEWRQREEQVCVRSQVELRTVVGTRKPPCKTLPAPSCGVR
jgi:hypothetical protein